MYDQRIRDICSVKDKKKPKLKPNQIFVMKKKGSCGKPGDKKKGKACKCK